MHANTGGHWNQQLFALFLWFPTFSKQEADSIEGRRPSVVPAETWQPSSGETQRSPGVFERPP